MGRFLSAWWNGLTRNTRMLFFLAVFMTIVVLASANLAGTGTIGWIALVLTVLVLVLPLYALASLPFYLTWQMAAGILGAMPVLAAIFLIGPYFSRFEGPLAKYLSYVPLALVIVAALARIFPISLTTHRDVKARQAAVFASGDLRTWLFDQLMPVPGAPSPDRMYGRGAATEDGWVRYEVRDDIGRVAFTAHEVRVEEAIRPDRLVFTSRLHRRKGKPIEIRGEWTFTQLADGRVRVKVTSRFRSTLVAWLSAIFADTTGDALQANLDWMMGVETHSWYGRMVEARLARAAPPKTRQDA